MSFLSNLFRKRIKQPKNPILKLIAQCSDIILGTNKGSIESRFEVMLFSSILLISAFQRLNSQLSYRFWKYYNTALLQYAVESGVDKLVPGSIEDFVDNRITLYNQEYQKMLDPNGIPTRAIYNFYKNPLQVNSGDSFAIDKVMRLRVGLKHLLPAIEEIAHFANSQSNEIMNKT